MNNLLEPNGPIRKHTIEFPYESDPNFMTVKYPCHGANKCSASWTYDNHHCTGCHWKGMGVMDLRSAKSCDLGHLHAKALELSARLNGGVPEPEIVQICENETVV